MMAYTNHSNPFVGFSFGNKTTHFRRADIERCDVFAPRHLAIPLRSDELTVPSCTAPLLELLFSFGLFDLHHDAIRQSQINAADIAC